MFLMFSFSVRAVKIHSYVLLNYSFHIYVSCIFFKSSKLLPNEWQAEQIFLKSSMHEIKTTVSILFAQKPNK
jgi:hypothetical protein